MPDEVSFELRTQARTWLVIRSERARWEPVAREAKMKVE
jgi:hypothetical protein